MSTLVPLWPSPSQNNFFLPIEITCVCVSTLVPLWPSPSQNNFFLPIEITCLSVWKKSTMCRGEPMVPTTWPCWSTTRKGYHSLSWTWTPGRRKRTFWNQLRFVFVFNLTFVGFRWTPARPQYFFDQWDPPILHGYHTIYSPRQHRIRVLCGIPLGWRSFWQQQFECSELTIETTELCNQVKVCPPPPLLGITIPRFELRTESYLLYMDCCASELARSNWGSITSVPVWILIK